MKGIPLSLAALAAFALGHTQALAEKPYTIVPVEGLPGHTELLTAAYMNESGMILGRLGNQSARWTSASTTPTLLGDIGPGFTVWPTGIDPAGAGYGYAHPHAGPGRRPLRWAPGSTVPVQLEGLGTDQDGNATGTVTAVSPSGLALGTVWEYSGGQFVGSKVVSWTGDSKTPTALHGRHLNAEGGEPLDMNASGTTVETVYSGVPSYPRPMRWSAQSEPDGTLLETFDDAKYRYSYQFPSYAFAINDAGVAVGYSTRTDRSPRGDILNSIVLGAKWEPGTAKIIPIASLLSANDINNAGAIVGVTGNGTGAIIFPGASRETDLNTLVDAGDQWSIGNAQVINDRGQILAGARYDADGSGPGAAISRTVLLDPKPLLADANGDMRVNFTDFQLLERNFGMATSGLDPAAARSLGDFDADGSVDADDFSILQDQFGWWIPAVPGAGDVSAPAPITVPEPALALAAIGLTLLLGRAPRTRRRVS